MSASILDGRAASGPIALATMLAASGLAGQAWADAAPADRTAATVDDLGPLDSLDTFDRPAIDPIDPAEEQMLEELAAEDEDLRARRARLRRNGRSPWPRVAVSLWWISRPDVDVVREPGRPDRIASDGATRFGWTVWALWSTP